MITRCITYDFIGLPFSNISFLIECTDEEVNKQILQLRNDEKFVKDILRHKVNNIKTGFFYNEDYPNTFIVDFNLKGGIISVLGHVEIIYDRFGYDFIHFKEVYFYNINELKYIMKNLLKSSLKDHKDIKKLLELANNPNSVPNKFVPAFYYKDNLSNSQKIEYEKISKSLFNRLYFKDLQPHDRIDIITLIHSATKLILSDTSIEVEINNYKNNHDETNFIEFIYTHLSKNNEYKEAVDLSTKGIFMLKKIDANKNDIEKIEALINRII